MTLRKALTPILILVLISCACRYIVLPEEETPPAMISKGWTGLATSVGKNDAGDLHIELTLRNETAAWSAMHALENKPAVLTSQGGKTSSCDTVFVSSGGHRLAPGFQMRGYTGGTKAQLKTQLIYVECKGAEVSPGAKLSIDYSYVTGQYNYYEPEANMTEATMQVELDALASDLTYPLAAPVEGLIEKADTPIIALNQCVLTLMNVTRSESGLTFEWQNSNPGEYPTYVHIGNPPVIGSDGIIYGFYETPDLASVPVTGASKTADWTTEVKISQEVQGLYILLSVESGKQRLYANYALDITGK